MALNEIEEQISLERIRQLEEAVMVLSSDIQHISQAVRDCQNMIVKIATNQQQMAERVSMWPYVKVESKQKPKPKPKPPAGDIY